MKVGSRVKNPWHAVADLKSYGPKVIGLWILSGPIKDPYHGVSSFMEPVMQHRAL